MLIEHYDELIAYRFEGMRFYGARFVDDIGRVPARIFYPLISLKQCARLPGAQLGPLNVASVPPVHRLALREMSTRRGPLSVLDVGCSDGALKRYLDVKYTRGAVEYIGVDIAPPPGLTFPVFGALQDVPPRAYDLIVMSEVAEHMTAEELHGTYLPQIKRLLADDGVFVLSTPNPLAPTVLQRDVTHVQHYPWYDIYAIMRMHFTQVRVFRTLFLTSFRRLWTLPVKRMLCYFLEVDWCDGLTLLVKNH